MEHQTGSKLGKEYVKAVYCHPAYLIYMQSTSREMPGWMKHKLESRLPGKISITSDMQMTQSKEELKSLFLKMKEESEKSGLKLNIQKTKIMASSPITSWQIDGETMETETDFIFLGSKITADGHCSHEIKTHLLLGRKAMTNLNNILKCRDVTFLTKVCVVKAMVFPGVMYGCESWDHRENWVPKNWCFWTLVLEKTLESPLDCKEIKPFNPKGNQPWRFTGMTVAEAEASILWPPDAKNWLSGKDPDTGQD